MPTGWRWVKLGEVCEKAAVVRRKEKPANEKFFYLDIGSIDNQLNKIVSHKEYSWREAPSRAQQILSHGDILYSTVRTYLKNVAMIEQKQFDGQIGSSGFCVIRGQPDIANQKFLFHYVLTRNFIKDLSELQTGTSYPAVRDRDIFDQNLPLPPLVTQQAIVAKIEELFSELDMGIEAIKLAQQQLKIYRQSVLKAAFEGSLTPGPSPTGRGEKEGLPAGWKWVKFGEANDVKSNLVSPKDYSSSPHIAPDNISKGTGKLLAYRTIAEDKVFSPKHKFFKGQILYSKIRPNLAKVAMAPFDGLCSADMYPIESKYDNKYTFWYMLSEAFIEKASNTESRTVLPKINQKALGEIPFPLPPLAEQQAIVAAIESRLSVADQLEATLAQSLEKAEALRQSILKQAFAGALV